MVTEYEHNELRKEIRLVKQRLARLEESLAKISPASAGVEPASPPPLPEWIQVEPEPSDHQEPVSHEPVGQAHVPELPDNMSWRQLEVQQTPAEPQEKKTLEQFIGLKGMLIFGVGFVVLACVFFFKYAFDQGWIVPTPPVRCLLGMIAGLIMLGFGEWTLRKRARLYAAAMFAGGVVLLYLSAWAASPNGLFYPKYEILGTNQAFTAMCVITVIGILLALRANMIAGGVIALIGAMATPILLSSGENRQIELMSYLLAVDAGFLILATLKRWSALVPIALIGTLVLFIGWFGRFGDVPESQLWTLIFTWAFTVLFAVWSAIAQKTGRASCNCAIAVVAVSSVAFVFTWLIMHLNCDMSAQVFLMNLLALNVMTIVLCQILRWHGLRLGVVIWTAVTMLSIYSDNESDMDSSLLRGWQIYWLTWAWGFFALTTIDIFVRAIRKFASISPIIAQFDAILALMATALITTATYFLGQDLFPDQLGLVTLAMAVCAIGISIILRKREGYEFLRTSYLVQGLALLTVAVPIQYDNAMVPLAWIALGVITMALARRLRNVVLLIFPPVVIILAVYHFCFWVLPDDPAMREICFSLAGLEFVNALAVAIALALGMLATAVMLHIGQPIFKSDSEKTLATVICGGAILFFAVMTAKELPLIPATWAWLIAAGLVLVTGLAVRAKAEWSIGLTGVLLSAAAFKWVFADTLGFYGGDVQQHSWVVLNPICLAGLVITAGFLLLPRIARRFSLPMSQQIAIIMTLVAAALVAWAGSFEVVRYVDTYEQALADPGKALQMGLSIWWSIWATVMLITGLAWRAPAARYFAILLYGVTVTKVLIVDMQGIDAIYRILSFLVLGVLLAIGSWAYYKFFKAALAKAESD